MPKYIKTIGSRNKIKCGCKTYMSAMLLQSDLNKWMISLVDTLDKLYVRSELTTLLQKYKKCFIEYKNEIFSNDLHIHINSCDAASSYYFPSQNIGSNIPKWDCILNYYSDFPRMNAP